jgi:hypothetical protein
MTADIKTTEKQSDELHRLCTSQNIFHEDMRNEHILDASVSIISKGHKVFFLFLSEYLSLHCNYPAAKISTRNCQ